MLHYTKTQHPPICQGAEERRLKFTAAFSMLSMSLRGDDARPPPPPPAYASPRAQAHWLLLAGLCGALSRCWNCRSLKPHKLFCVTTPITGHQKPGLARGEQGVCSRIQGGPSPVTLHGACRNDTAHLQLTRCLEGGVLNEV